MRSKRKSKILLGTGILIIIAIFGFGCSSNNSITNTENNGWIMMIHGGPDNVSLDVDIDGVEVASQLEHFTEQNYTLIKPGDHDLSVIDDDDQVVPLMTSQINVLDNSHYSLFMVIGAEDTDMVYVRDLFELPDTANQADVRFVNLSPNIGKVDVYQTTTDTSLSGAFEDIGYKDYTQFELIDGGTYSLQLMDSTKTNVLLTTGPIDFEGGNAYTIYAHGYLGGIGSEALGIKVYSNVN